MLGQYAITLSLLAIFPTDPIDVFPKDIFSLSWQACIHFGLVILFILLAPIGISRVYYAVTEDEIYKDLAPVTLICGSVAFVSCILWFLFFYFGILNEYRGLFQKTIVLIVLYWGLRIMNKLTTEILTPKLQS